MSIFASLVTKVLTVAGDPPHTITIQKLSGRACEVAQAEHIRGTVAGFTGRGWANSFGRKLLDGTATEAEALAVVADPLSGYDRIAVVRQGITGWSFTQPVMKDGAATDKTEPMPITDRTVGDIDDETLETLATEIMKLTKPGLFTTAAEEGSDRKKG